MKPRVPPAHRTLIAVVMAAAVIVGVLLLAPGARTGEPVSASASVPSEWKAKIKEPMTPTGGWRTARTSGLTAEQRAELGNLESLGYLAGGARATSRSGVTVHDGGRCWQSLNLYVSGDSPGAILMDMEGNVLHEWTYTYARAWPGRPLVHKNERGSEYWFHAHVFENGDIIGVFNGLGLVKLDKDSNLIWKYTGGSHHHIHVADDGRILMITRELLSDKRFSSTNELFEDAIVVLDADGTELSRVSLVEAFWNSDYASLLRMGHINLHQKTIDPFHTNRVVPLDNRLRDTIPAFREGNLLLSLRNLNSLAVLDMEQRKIVWTLSGMWLQQHCPSVLDNGNILLFDNQGYYGSSRIIELDPASQEVEWMYGGSDGAELYSEKSGTVQRLPNGNSLIAETHYGRAIEVTPDGEIVWEYFNPERAGESNEFIANLFEIERLPKDFPTDWLD